LKEYKKSKSGICEESVGNTVFVFEKIETQSLKSNLISESFSIEKKEKIGG